MKEKQPFLAVLAIALSTPLLTTLLATESIAFSNRFYLQQYEKLDLKQASGFERQEFIQFSQALWDYFHNRFLASGYNLLASWPTATVQRTRNRSSPTFATYSSSICHTESGSCFVNS